MARKDNTSLFLIIGAAAVVGYLYYKKSLTSQAAGALPTGTTIPGLGQLQTPAGIATETPSQPDLGIIAPKLDPTGMQINFM